MKEKANAILVPALAQCLGERHQVIIMHPDEVIRPEHLVQLVPEMIIDTRQAHLEVRDGTASTFAGLWHRRLRDRGAQAARPKSSAVRLQVA